VASGVLLRLPQTPLCDFETLRARAPKPRSFEFHVTDEIEVSTTQDFEVHLPPSFNGNLSATVKWIKDRQNENAIIVISTSHARCVRDILADAKVHHVHLLDAINEPQPGFVVWTPQRLTAGVTISWPS